jgi:O-antigen/teichoic acid export membrane protein
MILLVSGAQKKLMWALSSAAIFNIVVNLFLIPRFSYMGSALSSALTEMFVVGITASIAFRHIGYRPPFSGLSPIFFAGIGMAAWIAVLHGEISFFLLGMSAVSVYGGLLWLFRGVTREEIDIILSGRKLARESESQSAEHMDTIV